MWQKAGQPQRPLALARNECWDGTGRAQSGASLLRNENESMGSKLNWFVAGVTAGLTAAAIGQELAKPPEERTWKGRVAGVPYSFCLREWPEVASEYWNPGSDKIITPHVIGLGWGVNFAALFQRAQELLGQPEGAPVSMKSTGSPDQATAPVTE